MTITSTPSTSLPSVVRYENFNVVVTFAGTDMQGNPAIISSANCVKNFVDSEVLVANGISSVTISGRHTTAFANDEVKYVEKGSSDILQTPVIVDNFFEVPPDKDLFEVNQDPSPGVTRTYTFYVTSNIGSEEITLSQFVDNDVTAGYNFLTGYYP